MSAPDSCADALLDELCVGYGYCLSEDAALALFSDVPNDPDSFVDVVLVSEGFDPLLVDKHVREELRDVVRDCLFDEGTGRGTKSGLPRLQSAT